MEFLVFKDGKDLTESKEEAIGVLQGAGKVDSWDPCASIKHHFCHHKVLEIVALQNNLRMQLYFF